MNNLSSTACSFWIMSKKINKKNNSVQILDLNKTIIGKEKSYNNFFEVISDFCKLYTDFRTDDVEQKIFKVNTKNIKIEETDSFRYTYLDISSGGYGIEANIVNPENNEVVYTRRREDAEAIKFKVYIAIPKGEKTFKGIIIFQNIGQYGIKTITTGYLKKFIEEKLEMITTTGNICPEVFVKKLLESDGLRKVIYTRNNVSNDKADIDTIGYGREERTLTNFINLNGWKEKLSSYLNNNDRIYEFQDEKYDGIKLVTSIYGRERTINLNNLDRLSIIEGIPDKVRDKYGNIDDKLLKEHLTLVTKEYLEKMVYNKI